MTIKLSVDGKEIPMSAAASAAYGTLPNSEKAIGQLFELLREFDFEEEDRKELNEQIQLVIAIFGGEMAEYIARHQCATCAAESERKHREFVVKASEKSS